MLFMAVVLAAERLGLSVVASTMRFASVPDMHTFLQIQLVGVSVLIISSCCVVVWFSIMVLEFQVFLQFESSAALHTPHS